MGRTNKSGIDYSNPEEVKAYEQAYQKEYYKKTREKRKEYKKAHYNANRGQYSENGKKWRAENIERCREFGVRFRIENPDLIRKYSRDYYDRNKNNADFIRMCRKRGKAWRLTNPEKYKKLSKKSYIKNKVRIFEYHDNYRKDNPEKIFAYSKVAQAIRQKKLKRQPCEVCGSTVRINAHHDDYSKPLEVRWLCPQHHMELHNQNDTQNDISIETDALCETM